MAQSELWLKSRPIFRPALGLPSFAWFPDGKWVVTNGLALLSIETGETRSLTFLPTKSFPDFSPAVSPDGHTIAFSRPDSMFDWNIYLLDVTEDLKAKGEPRQLTTLKGVSHSPAWTPSGEEVIFASAPGLVGYSLWRKAVSGGGEPEKLPFGRGEASRPAISSSGNRLAYERGVRTITFGVSRFPIREQPPVPRLD